MNKQLKFQQISETDRSNRPKKPKTSTNQIQLHIACIYDDLVLMLEQSNIEIKLPKQVATATERVTLMKNIIEFLLNKQSGSEKSNNSNEIQCNQCATYEANLQKLENQIRQHIRVQQQLKLYHDNLQQKVQQSKRQKREAQKKYQSQKRHYEELKSIMSTNVEKISKLEAQNQKLKVQFKYKVGKIDDSRKQSKYNDGKQNKDYMHRNISLKKEDKIQSRKSVEKRPESTERWRSSINNKSTKAFPLSEKLIQQKNREQRKRVIQAKFQYRR